ITESAAIVFLISPQSVTPSSVCTKELALVRRLSLRIVPVMFRPPPAGMEIPSDLSSKDWIRCDELGRRYEPIAEAAIALKTAVDVGAPALELGRLEAELKSQREEFRSATAAGTSWSARMAEIERALSLDAILWRREAAKWAARARAWD